MACAYDLIVLDLDGTLLRSDGTVSEANRVAVQDARGAGIRVVIATGRSMVESRAAIEAIGHTDELITAGGALRQCPVSGRTLDRHTMCAEVVAEIAASLIAAGHLALILKDPETSGVDYVAVGSARMHPASTWWFDAWSISLQAIESIGDDPFPADSVRIGAVASSVELGPLAATISDSLGDRVSLQHWAAVTETGDTGAGTHLLEAFHPSAGKWAMVERYCAAAGIDPRRVAAIGDGLNDVDLVREAPLGIAMGNADERVRSVADRHTTSANDDGVALAIEAILEMRW